MQRSIPNAPSEDRSETSRISYAELKERWIPIFGFTPPKNLSRRLIEHAIAYEEQVRINGGLSEKTKKRLRELAAANGTQPENAKLPPGTRLVREWNGRTYVVEVTESGFRMDRREFGSLSAIAKAITGSHWNGRAFFGLVKRKKAISKTEDSKGNKQ